ncbi:SAM-dependent methyltransferase, partial [Trebonia sp.]|uniref:SAM-dependent methyltransferase n=1 Tax=Trebonia sp. TaxID=2767075 RepID=UPI002633DA81
MSDDWRDEATRRAKAELIDTTVPNIARAANYLGGGRDNFEADRKAMRAMIAVAPVVAAIVPAVRAFHQRAVRYLADEAGVRQFLDVGPGLATSGRTHEVAQSVDPRCRIVYASSDPMVLTHARALTKSTPAGTIDCVDAHIRDPRAVVAGARRTLDFGQPVAVLLLSTSTLSFIADTGAAAAQVSALVTAVPSGSYIAVYHQASDLHPAMRAAARRWNHLSRQQVTHRSRPEVASLVDGLELVPPGLVPV